MPIALDGIRTRGETNRSNIRIKVFVHRCSNFVSLFELFGPLAHAQNNLRSKKLEASFSDGRVICWFIICAEALRKEQRGGGGVLLRANFARTSSSGTGVRPAALEPHQRATRLCVCKPSKTVLSTWCTHIYSCLHILFFSTLVGKSLIIIMIYSCSNYSRIFDYSCCRKRIIRFAQNEYSFHP